MSLRGSGQRLGAMGQIAGSIHPFKDRKIIAMDVGVPFGLQRDQGQAGGGGSRARGVRKGSAQVGGEEGEDT